jgi:calcineurin-like phosphoesterase family protein
MKLSTKQQNVWFVSDYHLNHAQRFIWGARGFNSVEEHDAFLIERTNELVGQNDILFNLGDFSLNSSIDKTKDLLARIRCQNIYYLWGNHESYMKKIYNEIASKFNVFYNGLAAIEFYPIRYENVTFLGKEAEVIVDGQYMVLSHFPKASWNHSQHGSLHLCGHQHGNVKYLRPENTSGKRLDVGWDVFMKPVPFHEVVTIMNNKTVCLEGHH